MSFRLYSSLSREKETFVAVRPGKVGMYLCGPTVYKSPHIGHMVGPVIFDALKRFLTYKGFEVTWIVNITDVEDKLIDAARKRESTVQELADKYTAEYLDCLKRLGIDGIDRFPKASEHIAEIIGICQRLIASGHAYAAEGNVWFDVTSDHAYGKLSNRKVEEQESGLRALEGAGKRNPADFGLWKAVKPVAGEKAGVEPSWDSPWGRGRPGWHIECSAMSMKYLGETFDIHGGGLDLMFPHHENELAQSECCTGKPFAKTWMHNGLTRIKTKLASGEWADEKMSGSIGNVVSAHELLDKYGPELLRYMLLSTHYRRPIEFTDDVMTASRKGLMVFGRLFERVERLTSKPLVADAADLDALSARVDADLAPLVREGQAAQSRFLEMLDDDFNTAGAIAVLHELAGTINAFIEQHHADSNRQPKVVEAAAAAAHTLKKLGNVLGLFRDAIKPSTDAGGETLDQVMQLLIQIRNDARKNKNFALADQVRNGLTAIGIKLEDRPDGTGWRKE